MDRLGNILVDYKFDTFEVPYTMEDNNTAAHRNTSFSQYLQYLEPNISIARTYKSRLLKLFVIWVRFGMMISKKNRRIFRHRFANVATEVIADFRHASLKFVNLKFGV